MKKIILAKAPPLLIMFFFLSAPLLAQDEELLNDRIAKNSGDYVAMTKLGLIYQDKGDRKDALRLFKKAIKIAPNYPDAHLFLGRLYFVEREYDKAVEELNSFKDKIKYLSETNGEAKKLYINGLHYLSEIYFTLKNYEEARKEIEEILRISPKDLDAHYNLGVYYYTYEHLKSKAYASFNKVIEIEPTSYTAKRAKYAIEFMRANPDSRFAPDFSFIDKENR
ncbi:MAG: tetratricopeptide repeat protein [Candidatus Omnitrophota bacterium]|nr:tetratricopeptide repeat protein [Candidatus Omnitrophota bacterium]